MISYFKRDFYRKKVPIKCFCSCTFFEKSNIKKTEKCMFFGAYCRGHFFQKILISYFERDFCRKKVPIKCFCSCTFFEKSNIKKTEKCMFFFDAYCGRHFSKNLMISHFKKNDFYRKKVPTNRFCSCPPSHQPCPPSHQSYTFPSHQSLPPAKVK